MAVKITKKTPAKSVVKEAICGNCGVTLEYTPNDINKYSGKDYGGGPDGHTWIDCPNCKKKIILTAW